MRGSIASLNAALKWDLDEFDRGTRHIEGAFGKLRSLADGLTSAITRFGVRMTAGITAPTAAIAGFSIKAASDVKELQSAFDFTFGAISGRMNKWAEETGDAMGRATAEMKSGALAFGQLFKQAAPTEEAAARLSQRFTVLAQDVSSFYNVGTDETLQNLRSGLVGEAEPLRKFGVFLSAAAVEAKALELGLVTTGQELNEQGKIMARAALIAESLSDANNDVVRTSGSFANRVRALKSEMSELAVEIGEKLLPMAERFVGWAKDAVQWLRDLPGPVKSIVAGFGLFLAAIGPVSLALSTLAVFILPLFIAKFGLAGQLLIAIINPIGAALVYLFKFATSWTAISAALTRVIPLFLRLTGPIGLAISAILLFKDNVLNALSDVWKTAQETIGPPLAELMNRLSEISAKIGDAFDLLAQSPIGDFLRFSIELIGELIAVLIKLGGSIVIGAITVLVEALNAMAEYISGVVTTVQNLLEGDWAGAWEAAANVVGNALQRISNWIQGLFPQLSALLGMMAQVLGTSNTLGAAPGFAQSSLSNIESGSYVNGAAGLYGLAVQEALSGSSSAKGDFAAFGGGKTGRSRNGRSAKVKDLAARREEIRLAQALDVARQNGNIEEERSIQRQIDLRERIEAYKRAGLGIQAAGIAAEKDMLEIDEARAVANAETLDSHERSIDIKLAELRNDHEHLKVLQDEEFLEKRILFYREQEVDLVNATRRANEDLLVLEEARADLMAARLVDQERERQIELARIRGDDPTAIRALEQSLRRDDRISELRDNGLSEADAIALATKEALDRERAHLQGTFRDTFRGGLQAALNGNLGDFFENWMKQRSFDALADVLDRLADSLANLLFNNGSGSSGGFLGGLLSGIGGFFGLGGKKSVNFGGASGNAIIGKGFKGPAFASGGSFQVKGFPGIDQNVLSLNGNPVARVSSGEIMNVQKGEKSAGGVLEVRLVDEMLDARIVSGSIKVVRGAAPNIIGQAVDETIRQSGRPEL